jgi:hypothetical protein
VNSVVWDYTETRLFLNDVTEPYIRDLCDEVAVVARVLGSQSVDTGRLNASIHVVMSADHRGAPVGEVQSLGYGIFLDDTLNKHAEQMLHRHPFLVQALLDRETG